LGGLNAPMLPFGQKGVEINRFNFIVRSWSCFYLKIGKN
jgi:hypothetical protein